MLLSLSVCDLLVGILVFTFVPYYSIVQQDEFYIRIYKVVWTFVLCYLNITTLLHLIIIGMDRLWAIRAPFHHRIHTSHKKLVVLLGLCWCLPMIFILVNIISIFTQDMELKMVHVYVTTTMCSVVAKIDIVAAILLLFCYSAIICIIRERRGKINQSKHSNQSNSMNTLIMCIGIVLVFILFTAPFVAVYITIWERPKWLDSLSRFVLPLSQICNSLLYFLQKYRRSKRSVKTSRGNRQRHKESEDTRF